MGGHCFLHRPTSPGSRDVNPITAFMESFIDDHAASMNFIADSVTVRRYLEGRSRYVETSVPCDVIRRAATEMLVDVTRDNLAKIADHTAPRHQSASSGLSDIT